MLRDDEAFPPMYNLDTETMTAADAERRDERAYANNDLDDVFGSAPPSPTFEDDNDNDTSHAHTHGDTWEARGGRHREERGVEVSDIPRLKEKHETEGYRDGVTTGKGQSVQAGFDEGYGLGAVLGLKVGKILGLLEGILGAVVAGLKAQESQREGRVEQSVIEGSSAHSSVPDRVTQEITSLDGWRREKERLDSLFVDANQELSTLSIFGRDWWGEDGIWTFKIPGEGEGKDVVFPDVAAAHPLVVKWESVVDTEVKKWGLDLTIMDTDHTHEEMEDASKDSPSPSKRPKDGIADLEADKSGQKVMGVAKKQLNW